MRFLPHTIIHFDWVRHKSCNWTMRNQLSIFILNLYTIFKALLDYLFVTIIRSFLFFYNERCYSISCLFDLKELVFFTWDGAMGRRVMNIFFISFSKLEPDRLGQLWPLKRGCYVVLVSA